MTILLDCLRQNIEFSTILADQPLYFHSTWGLFSPREIDAGTRLLLKHIEVKSTDNCLDLGCGYGPIGITLAQLAPQGQVLLIDKDFVAVEYSNKNIARNRISNAHAMLSNGFDQIDTSQRFDLVASNIPAKVGRELLTLILHDTKSRLNPGGRLYIVTINGLRQFMKRNMIEVFGNHKKVKQSKQYTVAMCEMIS